MQQIALHPVAELIPYIRNPRTHSDEQVAVIAASIREFGWTNPVLIDGKNGIIAGHGRVLAARKLGINQVPCIELAHLSEAQRKAYVIADNQTAQRAGWDNELLHLELGDLRSRSSPPTSTSQSNVGRSSPGRKPRLMVSRSEKCVPNVSLK